MSVQIEILSSKEAWAYATLTKIPGPTPTVEIDLCCLTWDYCEVPGTWQLSFDGDPVVVPVFPGSVNQGSFDCKITNPTRNTFRSTYVRTCMKMLVVCAQITCDDTRVSLSIELTTHSGTRTDKKTGIRVFSW